jgi:hypothetical protein
VERSGHSFILNHYLGTCLQELGKKRKHFQNRRHLGQDLKMSAPGYRPETLLSVPTCSLLLVHKILIILSFDMTESEILTALLRKYINTRYQYGRLGFQSRGNALVCIRDVLGCTSYAHLSFP